MGFTQVFGGQAVKPAQVQYQALTISADTALLWPTETMAGVPYVAAEIDVAATSDGLSLVMPNAQQGATGVACILTNVGAHDVVLKTCTGVPIITVAVGVAWIITLTDNSTDAGTWRATQLGATTSQGQASQLAGAGLEAFAGKLRLTLLQQTVSVNTGLDQTFRAVAVKWTGADGGVLQIDDAATLGDGWFCLVTNEGAGSLELTTTGGDLINGQASMVLPEGAAGQYYSFIVVCDGATFDTYGGTPRIIPLSGGGTGADSADQALINFGGTTIGIDIFTALDAAAVLTLLGISTTPITESTVSTNQILSVGSQGTAFVCEAALTITLPPAPDLTTSWFFLFYAIGGALSLIPNGPDNINGSNANLNVPQGASGFVVTDAEGNFWVLFLSTGGSSGGSSWAIAGGTADAITANYTPAITGLTDGLLLSFRASGANTVVAPTFAPDGLAAQPITKEGGLPLIPGDIFDAGYEVQLRYNLPHTRWEMLNPSSAWLDAISSTPGTLAYRAASLWMGLAPGTEAQVLRQHGGLPEWDWEQPGQQTNIVGAATVDLGTITTHNALITGTGANITSFGNSASLSQPIYWVEFANANTIVDGASLLCPGAADIITAAGDCAEVEFLGSGMWRIRNYTVSSTGGGPGGGTISAVQGISFTVAGGSVTVIESFGGVSITRTGTGTFDVTLGAAALNMGFFIGQAVNNSSGDTMAFNQPVTELAAGNTYTFQTRYCSSKTVEDPLICMLLFY